MVREYFRQAVRFSPAARLFLAGQVFFGVGQAAVWVLRNLFLKEAGFSESLIGNAMSAASLGMVLVVVPLTRWMDRMRLRGFAMTGAFILAASLAGTALFPERRAVLGLSFLTGAGAAMVEVCAAPFLARHSAVAERPWLFGVSTALSPTAGLFATLGIKAGASAWGENFAGYRALMFAGAGITLLAIPAFAFIRETAAGAVEEVRDPFDWRTAAKFCLPELVFGLGAGFTIPFINLYFRNRFHLQAGTIGLYYSGAQALMVGAFLASPLLARRFGATRTVVGCQALSIPFFFVLAVTTSLPVAVVCFLLRHACMNMVHPVSANLMMEVMNPRQRVRLNGMKQASKNIAWVAATSSGGFLIEHTRVWVDGFTTVMLITIGLYGIGSVMFWKFLKGEPSGKLVTVVVEPGAGR